MDNQCLSVHIWTHLNLDFESTLTSKYKLTDIYMSTFSYIDSFSEIWEIAFFSMYCKLGTLKHCFWAGHPAVELCCIRVKPKRQRSAIWHVISTELLKTGLTVNMLNWLFKQVNKQQFLSAKDSDKLPIFH